MRGFTLLELIAVMLVLALLSGLAAVSLASLKEPEAGLVAASLAQARGDAIASGRTVIWRDGPVVIRFEPDGSSSGGQVPSGGVLLTVDALSGIAHATR
jgi:prepilin-type N-terminal cleavage/methylation domain-containing protein